jgi:glycosyltransferase involved in cell wall biosynthesis
MTDKPLRVLFVNEGSLDELLGHVAYERSLRLGAETIDDVSITFTSLPRRTALEQRLSRRVPGLGHLHLDLQPLRWHLMQARRARRLVEGALSTGEFDVAFINSHSIAFGLGKLHTRVPIVLSADSSVRAFHRMTDNPVWSILPSVALERRALRRARHVVAWTEWAKETIRQEAPDVPISVNHPGIDLTRFQPAPHPRASSVRMLFVGGRFQDKGGPELLEAAQPFLGHDLVLDVVTAEPVPTTPGVTVHRLRPEQPELADLYARADLFCLPTRSDTMGFAILEAMASGLPIVTTRVGAIAEVVSDTAVVVPVGDPAALARAIRSLLDDPDRARTLGVAARRRVEDKYDVRKEVPALIEVLRGIAAAR